MSRRFGIFDATALGLGFAFLYLPILVLIAYSFNASRLVSVWGGFSTKWYGELLANEALLEAAWLSLKIGLVSATLATVLGVMAAYALVRAGPFLGRTLFGGMVLAPLVTPDVMLGLSLLLTLIAADVDRGWGTITLAHATFSIGYVAVVVSSRLAVMDRSIEEAAADLGAPPWDVFLNVTLPAIAPAAIAGWLLAFTLSLDDLVVASFVSGPGSTTLPIKLFSSMRLGVSPEINALSTILIVLATLSVIAASVAGKWSAARRLTRAGEGVAGSARSRSSITE